MKFSKYYQEIFGIRNTNILKPYFNLNSNIRKYYFTKNNLRNLSKLFGKLLVENYACSQKSVYTRM